MRSNLCHFSTTTLIKNSQNPNVKCSLFKTLLKVDLKIQITFQTLRNFARKLLCHFTLFVIIRAILLTIGLEISRNCDNGTATPLKSGQKNTDPMGCLTRVSDPKKETHSQIAQWTKKSQNSKPKIF